ncbi:type III pantothenate kinase [Peredibacter starrii]|uniref:Type III pantothenate kinase n=1 Tax=Peredibacter starrii TaxID=28202 RepID=A0AAX4HNB1_9BACT|nr:type III pantothenate kinase [Peredibacter starrii]WPU64623.1 type III pantothenate kinase [Peredibacter starrii]
MQGLITLDFGNSNPHAGLFQKVDGKWDLIKVVPFNELQIYTNQLGMSANNSSVVLCEVKSREEELAPLAEQGYLITRVKEYWRGTRFAGMPVNYAKTLGEDRLIEAFYCYKKEKIPTLLIDAGTFVTMDVITENGFMGGYIIPGTEAYFSTYGKGEQLKDVPLTLNFKHQLPQETADAITESYSAFAALAKSLISEHKIQKIVLTGGLTTLWEGFFTTEKTGLVVEGHPHLIHWALQYWMTTQIEPL